MPKINCMASIQSLPSTELVRIVEKVIDYIKSTGLNYYVGTFDTSIEGEFEQVMAVIKECQLLCIREGAPQVATHIKLLYSPEEPIMTIDEKITKYNEVKK